MVEIENEKKGINSFTLRIIGLIILSYWTVYSDFRYSIVSVIPDQVWMKYLSWVCYPIFAFLLAVGFDQTSNKIKYFARLVIFAALAEIPYNYINYAKIINFNSKNGMFTLTLGYLVLLIIDFVYKKTNNLIISGLLTYFIGFGAYKLTKLYNFEFYTYGIMMIIVFWISRRAKYTKLLQLAFFIFLVFYVETNASITFIIGNIQYSISYRVLTFIPLFITYLYNEKRGPNSLGMKIIMYLYYPVFLAVLCLIKYL